MNKAKGLTVLIIYFIIMSIITILINLLLATFAYLYIIDIILLILTFIITIYLIYNLYSKPLTNLNTLAKHYNDYNFAYKVYINPSKDITELAKNIDDLAYKLKNINQKYHEIKSENQTYYEQYQLDLENKKQLVASISHEIKTPLAVIEATASALYDDIFPAESFKDELNNIIKECDKTSEMIQEIVNIYKLDNINYELEATNVNIATIIKEVINDYANLINKYQKQIIISNNLNFSYELNYNQFKKAIENIMLNAIIYSPLNETITITLKDETTYKVLEIINYGVTIDKKAIRKIFEPFYRIDEARTKGEDYGNGLGLYIVKEILEKHHLDYGITNVLNGVKFYIIFKQVLN